MTDANKEFPEVIDALFRWWQGLEQRKGDRAALRRCSTTLDVALTPAYQALYGRLVGQFSNLNADRIAAIVGLLSHIRQDDSGSPPAKSLSQGDKPVLSPLRFRLVLQTQSVDELYPLLRRALPLVKHTINVRELARDVYYWSDRTRKAWAYGYQWPEKSSS
jgi:CRISPR system Cascade subunit CasB